MGNAASNNAGRPIHQRRTQSPSPGPGAPHRSLRTKKKSLELPDLASLTTATNTTSTSKTASIPIPTSPADQQRDRGRPVPSQPFSSTDLLDHAPHQQQFPPRATPYYRQQQQQQIQQRRIQDLYNKSHVPPSDAEAPFVHEVVRSSIPIALQPKVRLLADDGTPLPANPSPIPVTIYWKGGGHHVLLARAGDDDWRGRTLMLPESPSSPVFVATAMLLPGTHHIRFLVDDQWRVADDLPTAVDDQGSLANYVAVPFVAAKAKDPSFLAESVPGTPSPAPAPGPLNPSTPAIPAPKSRTDVPNPAHQAQWTSVLPPELLEAFKEEEMYLAANQGQFDALSHQHRVSGFVPAPNIPPAPALPRHLDKLILNMRVSPGPGAGALGGAAVGGVNAAAVVQSAGAVGGSSGAAGGGAVGSGQGTAGRAARRDRDRTREERREERRRGRERGYSDAAATGSRRMPPPPPPPTEVGEPGDELAPAAEMPVVGEDEVPAVNAGGAEADAGSGTPNHVGSAAAAASTSPPASSPAAPSTPNPGLVAPSGPSASSPAPSLTLTPALGPAFAPSSFVPSTPTPASTLASNLATPTGATTPSSTQSTTTPSSPPPPPVPSRTITIDTNNMPSLTDDASVLPVPSHVVLHHLCTSAIRNGVLAVASTVRYRKKYLTSIYYKPT